jgi:hypothetical protein
MEMESHYDKLNKKLDRLQGQKQTTMQATHRQQRTYPRTINLTNIHFTREEKALLDLGLQSSLQKPLTTTWTNLTLETVQVIKLLDHRIQNSFCIIAAKKTETDTQHQPPQHYT